MLLNNRIEELNIDQLKSQAEIKLIQQHLLTKKAKLPENPQISQNINILQNNQTMQISHKPTPSETLENSKIIHNSQRMQDFKELQNAKPPQNSQKFNNSRIKQNSNVFQDSQMMLNQYASENQQDVQLQQIYYPVQRTFQNTDNRSLANPPQANSNEVYQHIMNNEPISTSHIPNEQPQKASPNPLKDLLGIP